MRGLVITIGFLTIGSAIARAQAPPLDDNEITKRWIAIQTMAMGIDESEGTDHFASHGVSKEGAIKLVEYVRHATAEFNAWAGGYTDRVCSQAESLRAGGQEALAQFFEKSRSTSSALRRRYVNEANVLLDEADKERLEHLFTSKEHGAKVTFIPNQPDVIELARTGVLTVEQVLKRNKCVAIGEAQQ